MKQLFGVALALLSLPCLSAAQSDSQTYKVTSPAAPLVQKILGPATDKSHPDFKHPLEPYATGVMKESFFATNVLPQLANSADGAYTKDTANGVAPPSALVVEQQTTTIIHLLRWKDKAHTTVLFEKWYLYDPKKSRTSFELQTASQVFQRATIPGTKHLQLVYIHINSDLSDPSEGIDTTDLNARKLTNPVSYSIAVTKQQTQLVKDFKSLTSLLGWTAGTALAASPTNLDDAQSVYGYWSASTFDPQHSTSQIVITASLNTTDVPSSSTVDPKTKKATSSSTTGQLSSKTYNSEKPSYIALGFAIPVTSYNEITYNSTSSTISPSTASKATVTVTGDLYLPPAQAGLMSFRYVPHLLFGLPIKGKVLQHTMLGAGIGLHWISPYAAVVFDTNYGATTGATPRPGHLVMKGSFGIEVSVSSAVTLLKGK